MAKIGRPRVENHLRRNVKKMISSDKRGMSKIESAAKRAGMSVSAWVEHMAKENAK